MPYNVTEGEDLAAGMGARSVICKRVHELSLGSLDSWVVKNIKLAGNFPFREYHVPTLSKIADLKIEAQTIADLRPVLATFCGQEMA